MSELITVEKLNSVAFYQIPQAFYYHPKYAGMSGSARETYAILRNLLGEHYLESDLLEEVSEDKSEGGSSGTPFGRRENSITKEDKTEVQIAEKPIHNNNTFINNHDDKTKDTLLPVVKEVVLAKENLVDGEILSEFHRSFGMGKVSMKAQEVLRMFLNRFEHSVVLYAFELAGAKNKSFDYAQGILRRWWQAEAFSFDEVFAYEERYSSGM